MPTRQTSEEVRIDIGPSVREGWVFIGLIAAALIWYVSVAGISLPLIVVLAVSFAAPGPKLPKETYLEADRLHVGSRAYDVAECVYQVWGFDNLLVRHGGKVVAVIYKIGRGYRDAIAYLSERDALDPATEDKLAWKPTGM